MKRLAVVLVVMGLGLFLFVPVAGSEEVTVDDYIDFWRPTIGLWEGTIEMDGETHATIIRKRIAPNNKCILFTSERNGVPGTQQLQGYDPRAGHAISWVVDNEGRLRTQTIVIDGLKKGLKAAEGVGGSWTLTAINDDGTTVTTTCRWTVAELSQTRWVMVWSDVKEDGQPKPDIKMILERQQPARKRRAQ